MESQIQNLVEVEGNTVIFKDNPGKKLTRHVKSESHKDAINTLTKLKIKHAFEKIDGPRNREKK